MHKISYNNAPLCLFDLFTNSVTVPSHLIRNVTVHFHVNYSRTKLFNNSFVNTGIRFVCGKNMMRTIDLLFNLICL